MLLSPPTLLVRPPDTAVTNRHRIVSRRNSVSGSSPDIEILCDVLIRFGCDRTTAFQRSWNACSAVLRQIPSCSARERSSWGFGRSRSVPAQAQTANQQSAAVHPHCHMNDLARMVALGAESSVGGRYNAACRQTQQQSIT